MITLTFDNLQNVRTYFNERPEAFRNAMSRIIAKAAFIVERLAKTSPYMRVDTGRMRASIGGSDSYGGGSFKGGVMPAGSGRVITPFWATVSPAVDYAKYVHEKYPFMTDAAEKAGSEIANVASEEVKKAIE
jgi:hypothetical protein